MEYIEKVRKSKKKYYSMKTLEERFLIVHLLKMGGFQESVFKSAAIQHNECGFKHLLDSNYI